MSGGARMLACRKEGVAITVAAATGENAGEAGAAIAGATARQALRQLP